MGGFRTKTKWEERSREGMEGGGVWERAGVREPERVCLVAKGIGRNHLQERQEIEQEVPGVCRKWLQQVTNW